MKNNDFNKTMIVFIEKGEHASPRGHHLQLLALSNELCASLKATLTCLVAGNDSPSFDAALLAYADKVVPLVSEGYTYLNTDTYAMLLAGYLEDLHPCLLLMADTPLSRALAPELAHHFSAGIISGATSVSFQEKTPIWGKAVSEGMALEEYKTLADFSIITVRSGIYKKPPLKKENGTLEPIRHFTAEERCLLTDLKCLSKEGELSPEDSEIVVAGGRGVGGPNGFKLIYELAEALDGAVAASRPAVDLGWISRLHQIGQTGSTISPRLYIACGISGALQHVSGMRNSDVIVAINSDPSAPIFKYADYGICGNLFQVIPAMIADLASNK